MNRDREDPPADIVGLSMEEAVEAVLTANESKDPEEVRQVLDHVTENGVVTEAAAEQTLSDVSMVLTTAESRVEYASTALSDAKEAVADVTDVPTVESRLDRFEKHVETVEELSVELGNDLQRIIDRRDDWGVYESTVALRELTTDAQEVQRTADDLKFDIEDLERYVTDPSVRVDELVADVDEVAGFLDGVEDGRHGRRRRRRDRRPGDGLVRRHPQTPGCGVTRRRPPFRTRRPPHSARTGRG